MKRIYLGLVPAVMVLFGIVSTANAALLTRLGGSAVYDDVLDITWLSNANLAETNTFGVSGVNSNGTMDWAIANNWISAMNLDGTNGYLGFSNWRLPSTLIPDASCTSDQAGTTSSGNSTGFNCSGSEMGNLFYSSLGGTPDQSITASGDADLALFSNIQDDNLQATSSYFSSTEDSSTDAWRFRFGTGSQFAVDKDFNLYGWAVRDGDVAAVPVPAAVWLFGSGLLGLVSVARRKVS